MMASIITRRVGLYIIVSISISISLLSCLRGVAFVNSFSGSLPTLKRIFVPNNLVGHSTTAWTTTPYISTRITRRLTPASTRNPKPITTTAYYVSTSSELQGHYENNRQPSPIAVLLLDGGSQSLEEEHSMLHILESVGYSNVLVSQQSASSFPTTTIPDRQQGSDNNIMVYYYELSRATGMLKLVSSPILGTGASNNRISSSDSDDLVFVPPKWVPIVRGEENVLVSNGWSFLDPDESEPISAYDIDDANAEAEYRPKWGTISESISVDDKNKSIVMGTALYLSSLGYDISQLSKEDIMVEAEFLSSTPSSSSKESNENDRSNNPYSRGVLLNGQTDPPNTKITCNGYNFRGSAGQGDIPAGIFFTAIGGLPLFASTDLSPTTGSSEWLSFSRPLDIGHVLHIDPEKESMDRRTEVVCARTRCHIGHYFGPTEGYCINASALKFISSSTTTENAIANNDNDGLRSSRDSISVASRPISWRTLGDSHDNNSNELIPSHRLLKILLEKYGKYEEVALGCGCFWHVEYALRRLPGVHSTKACYAGGNDNNNKASPTYQDVCEGNTGYAEVVSVLYDPETCSSDVLFDCFLAMHDPTNVRAHGKHAVNTGQYRSCIFVTNNELEKVARDCLEQCRRQLGKDLSTDIRLMQQSDTDTVAREFGQGWCWKAEDRHQRHDEITQRKLSRKNDKPTTLVPTRWLEVYGRRTPSVIGGSIERFLHTDDDGMAMMMI